MTTDSFEERLLTELRAVVADRPSPVAAATPRRVSHPRRPWLVTAGTAAAAAAAVAVVLASGDGAAPAYAVDRQADGSVTVSVRSLSDADGLEAKLRAAGIDAVVDYTPPGRMCREPRGRMAAATGGAPMSTQISQDAATFTIPRDAVGSGRTLVISASEGNGVTSLATGIVEGPVAPCTLVDAPPLPPATSGAADSGPGRSVQRAEPAGPSLSTGGASR